jgi:hypothetical protein
MGQPAGRRTPEDLGRDETTTLRWTLSKSVKRAMTGLISFRTENQAGELL